MIREPMTNEEIANTFNKPKEVMALLKKTPVSNNIDIKWFYAYDPVYGSAGGAEVHVNGKLLFKHLPDPRNRYDDWTDKEIFYEILERLGYEVFWEEKNTYYEEESYS